MACLRALSDAERRDVLRSSVLWAFKRYKGSRGEGAGADGEDAILAAAATSGEENEETEETGEEEGGGETEDAVEEDSKRPLHPNAIAWKQAGDAYMAALFGQAGKEDRAGGTRKQLLQGGGKEVVGAGGDSESTGKTAGARKLSPSSEVHSWVGGSLEYTSEGVKSVAPKRRKGGNGGKK